MLSIAKHVRFLTAPIRANAQLTAANNVGNNILNPVSDASQFSKARLVAHGELEDGEIPEALRYSRACETTSLQNGMRVATEAFASPIGHITLAVKSGVRNENIKNNGVGYFLEHLLASGTASRSKSKLLQDLDDIGAMAEIEAGREVSTIKVSFLSNQIGKVFEILGDMSKNSNFNKNDVESVRSLIVHQFNTDLEPRRLTLDNVHYTAFRDHMIGQPIRGNKISVQNIQQEDIVEHYKKTWVGDRMVLGASGGVDHKQVVELAEKAFGSNAKNSDGITGDETPMFTGSQIQIRDDDLDLAHCGVFYRAPGWDDQDFYPFMVLKELMGDYVPERDMRINHPQLQYNHLHNFLGEMEDICAHDTPYYAYSDVGLIGGYSSTLDVSAFMTPISILKTFRKLTSWVSDAELYRSRNKVYNNLLNAETPESTSQDVALQTLYAGRRIHRSEAAKRVSNLDRSYLEKVYSKWMWDCELAMVFYGPIFMQARAYGIYRSHTNDTNQI